MALVDFLSWREAFVELASFFGELFFGTDFFAVALTATKFFTDFFIEAFGFTLAATFFLAAGLAAPAFCWLPLADFFLAVRLDAPDLDLTAVFAANFFDELARATVFFFVAVFVRGAACAVFVGRFLGLKGFIQST